MFVCLFVCFTTLFYRNLVRTKAICINVIFIFSKTSTMAIHSFLFFNVFFYLEILTGT